MAACVAGFGACALAQQAPLPADVLQASSALSASQQQALGEYLKAPLASLAQGEIEAVRKAREQILEPLDQNASVVFRQAYARAVLPALEPLINAPDERVAVNALRLAGELAVPEGLTLIEPQTRASKPALRYAAVFGLTRAFERTAAGPPTITADPIAAQVRRLGPLLASESDPLVADAVVRALAAAAGVAGQGYEALRPLAVGELVAASAKRVAALSPSLEQRPAAEVILRAAGVTRDQLTGAGPLPEAVVKEAAAFGGDLLVYAARLIRAGQLPAVERSDDAQEGQRKKSLRLFPSQLVAAGENIIFFARTALRAGAEPTSFRASIEEASTVADAKYLEGITELVGPAGVLTRPPFGVAAQRFEIK